MTRADPLPPTPPGASEATALLTHRALGGTTRVRLMSALRSTPEPRSVAQLAAALDLHPNTVREQLEPLLALGLVRRDLSRPVGRGRPGYRYTAGRRGDGSARRSARPSAEPAYRALAAALADQIASGDDRGAQAEAAGERWGRGLVADAPPAPTVPAAVEVLVTLLDAAGFAPQSRPGPDGAIGLRHCPFAAIVDDRQDVVCGVHLGLMRGALEGLGAPLRADRLAPFVRPDLCLAFLRSTADA